MAALVAHSRVDGNAGLPRGVDERVSGAAD
jgi:hypothetical protein